MTAKIGLFPASGHLASSITTHLFNLVPPSQFILVARHPDKLAEATRAGATVRRGDYDDPSTLERVFDGVGVLMLVSYPGIEVERRFEVSFYIPFFFAYWGDKINLQQEKMK